MGAWVYSDIRARMRTHRTSRRLTNRTDVTGPAATGIHPNCIRSLRDTASRLPRVDTLRRSSLPRARKVSGQRSGLEAHGARPVWAARGGLDGGGEAGCASAAARRRRRAGLCVGLCWPKQRLRRRQEAGEGSGAGLRTGRRSGRRGYGYTLASRPAPFSTQFPLAPLSFTRAL